MFAGKAGAYPSEVPRLERLAKDKRSNLLWKVVTYGRKKFYNIGPRWQFHKHIMNVTYGRSKIS